MSDTILITLYADFRGPGRFVVHQVAYVLHRNVQRFRGGLVFKAHRLGVSLNSRLESKKKEEEVVWKRANPARHVRAYVRKLITCEKAMRVIKEKITGVPCS